MIDTAWDGLSVSLKADLEALPRDAKAAMATATGVLKGELRDQVERAGLGRRLATTWQGQVYPENADSLEPSGYVWSKAPNILAAYAQGATIVPVSGQRFLAIPTKNVPLGRRKRGMGSSRRPMSPFEVELEFDQDLILRRGRRGTILAFVDVLKGLSRRRPGFRVATPRRLAQGRRRQLVLMFVFAPAVRVAKVLDLQAAGERAARVFVSEMERQK
ncbi:MAG: hypothetical protein FJ335_10235 [Sphingomonadales bacterium]|nr:hypothetical protein [Sphingomonadales bacterium]